LALDFAVPVALLGTGMYVPEKVVTNEDLSRMVDTTDEWITERTGIRERHIASEGEVTSDFAARAGMEALKAAGVSPEEIDMIIVGTNSPDSLFPGVGPLVQGKIGAVRAGACDVQAGCTGCVYALAMASAGIGSGLWKKVLVIGAEALSRIVDWKDRNTCVLFGDGAGAVVLGASEGKNSVLAVELHADGALGDYIEFPGGLAAKPATCETVEAGEHFVRMKGNEVFKYVNRIIPPFVKDLCGQAKLDVSEIDSWIFHQANLRIIEGVLRRLDIPVEKAVVNLQKYGNTSAASVFLALHEGISEGKINRGDKAMLVSFGAGMTYGAIILEI
jgi:3-oxoacyl-[acyl-carrier-protein] synthase-3